MECSDFEAWLSAVELLTAAQRGLAFRKLALAEAAERCQIHPSTAFRWRHRFLAALNHDKPERLSGVVEADETFILEFLQGSPGRSGQARPSAAARPPSAASRTSKFRSWWLATAAAPPSMCNRIEANSSFLCIFPRPLNAVPAEHLRRDDLDQVARPIAGRRQIFRPVLAQETQRHAVGDVQALTVHRSRAEDDLSPPLRRDAPVGSAVLRARNADIRIFLICATQADRSRGTIQKASPSHSCHTGVTYGMPFSSMVAIRATIGWARNSLISAGVSLPFLPIHSGGWLRVISTSPSRLARPILGRRRKTKLASSPRRDRDR